MLRIYVYSQCVDDILWDNVRGNFRGDYRIQDVELSLNISATLPFTMMDKVLMLMGDVEIGLIPAPLPHTIQLSLVYCWVYLFMVPK